MFKKTLSFALIGLLMLAVNPAFASSKTEKQARLAEKVKAGILKLGVGEETRVAIKLRDKTKLAGYISEASENFFVVTDLKTGAASTVTYANVVQVSGQNLTTRSRIIIGIAFVVGLIVLIAIAAPRS